MADMKYKYAASAALAMTSLNSLASSTTLLAGAESSAFDNGVTLFDDVIVGLTIKMGTVACTASKSIEVWVVPALDDTPTFPDVFDGTDSAETASSRNVLFGAASLGKSFVTDVTANLEYEGTLSIASVLGYVPDQFVLFIPQDSGQALAASGHVIKTTGIHYQSV